MASPPPLELDGTTLEGGGQLLRLATGLSALTHQPIRIHHIRGNRPGGGGLKAQHLACVNWLAEACSAHVEGAEKGSRELLFLPRQKSEGERGKGVNPPVYSRAKDGAREYWRATLDIRTAGSTGLGLQAILPFLLFSPPLEADGSLSPVPLLLTLRGGTNVSASPSYDYIARVLLPTLEAMGLPQITPTLQKRGWSHGGTCIGSFTLLIAARMDVALPTVNLWPADTALEPLPPTRLEAVFIAPAASHATLCAALPVALNDMFNPEVIETLKVMCEDSGHAKRYYLLISATVPAHPSVKSPTHPSSSPKSYILARDALYASKIRSPTQCAVEMAESVARELFEEWKSGAWVDEFMRDQIVVFQALCQGSGRVWGGWPDEEISEEEGKGQGKNEGEDGGREKGQRREREASLHARTAEWVVEQMLGKGKDRQEERHEDGLEEGVGKLELG